MNEINQYSPPEALADANKEEIGPQRAIVLLKPDALEYRNRLIEYLESKGLKILEEKSIKFDKDSLYKFYPAAHDNIRARYPEAEVEKITEDFENSFINREVLSFLIEGNNAIEIVNRLKKKVRGLLHLERPRDGLHASDSLNETERERKVIEL